MDRPLRQPMRWPLYLPDPDHAPMLRARTPTAVSAETASNITRLQTGFDPSRAAKTLGTMANVAVFESCTARCSSTTTCVALNYFRRTSTCTLLKDKSGISSANDDTDSAQLNTGGSFASLPLDASGAYNPPNSEFAFQVATNMVFGYSPSDLTRSVATTNFADCINQCATTDRCVMVKPKWLLEISPNYYDFDSTALRRVKYRHHTEDGAEDAAAVGS